MRPPALPLLLAALAASFVPSFSEDGGVCEGSGYLIAFPPPVGLLGSRWGSEWTAAEPSNAYLLVGLDAAREKANEVAFSYCGAGLGGATVTCEAQVKGKLAEVIREGGSGGGQGHMSVDELCGYLDHELCFPEAAAAAVVVQMPASDFGRLKFIFEPLGNEEVMTDFYTTTSFVPTSRFFCQWHYEQSEMRSRSFEDLMLCADTVVEGMNNRAPRGELAVHHAALRMAFYGKHTDLLSTDPTPSAPHCFKGYEGLGCLFLLHNTDKGGSHGYHRTYSRVLREFRKKRGFRMLEIGVFRGSSTKVWEDFFQGGQEEFYGLGYGTDYFAKGQQDSKVKYGEKTTLYYGDQSDQNVLKYLVQDIGQGLDVIIDDGSHDPEDQILGFNMLFPLLNDGGVYILEDIEMSYWNRPGASVYGHLDGTSFSQPLGVWEEFSLVDKFLNTVHFGAMMNGLFLGASDKKKKVAWKEEKGFMHMDNISNIEFAHNLIIVRKGAEVDEWFERKNKPYVHAFHTA